MSNLKAIVKLIRFLWVTGFYYSVILFGRFISIFGADKIAIAAKSRHKWGIAVMKILKIDLKIEGTPPKPPFFLVANHLSYIDVWILFATSYGTFIAKSDVQNWPVAGFILSTVGLIFVDREKRSDVTRVNEEVKSNITEHQGIFLFPESTTSNGEKVLPFRTPLFQFPAATGLEVTSAAITYHSSDPTLDISRKICWWDDTPFPVHFWNVLKLDEFRSVITFSDEKIVHSDRKFLAQRTQSIVEELFNPISQSEIHA